MAGQGHFWCLRSCEAGTPPARLRNPTGTKAAPAKARASARTEPGGADGLGPGKAARPRGASCQAPAAAPPRAAPPHPGFAVPARASPPPHTPLPPGPAAAGGADPRGELGGAGQLPGLTSCRAGRRRRLCWALAAPAPTPDGRAVRRDRRPPARPGAARPPREAAGADPNAPRVTSESRPPPLPPTLRDPLPRSGPVSPAPPRPAGEAPPPSARRAGAV